MPLAAPPGNSLRFALPLLALFGTLYFVQGIIEPTACLPAQPIQAQLRGWGFSADQIGRFFGVIGIAWSIKPLFGLMSDFLPIAGRRRLPYLILATTLTAAAFFALALFGQAHSFSMSRIGWLLIFVGVGVATTDVVTDAVAVETGQPLGLTGQIQSVQWFAHSVAGLLVGFAGGFVTQHNLQRAMFIVCGLLAAISLVIVVLGVREPPHARSSRENVRAAWDQLCGGRQLMTLAVVAAFLFLWNFNPFSSNVLQDYMTNQLGLSEQFYGNSVSLQALGHIAACAAYFWYCRRVPFGALLHASIVAGIIGTFCYWPLRDATTAVLASVIWGFAWQTGVLIQLDLAARICPPAAAGFIFALLMAMTNTGASAGTYFGGSWYDALTAHFQGNRHLAFQSLIVLASLFTAACWLLVPLLTRPGCIQNSGLPQQ